VVAPALEVLRSGCCTSLDIRQLPPPTGPAAAAAAAAAAFGWAVLYATLGAVCEILCYPSQPVQQEPTPSSHPSLKTEAALSAAVCVVASSAVAAVPAAYLAARWKWMEHPR